VRIAGITEEEEDIMSKQKLIKQMTGYKATDANMKCRGFQFTLGEWAEASGDLVLCGNGFHFCEQASGPRCYYNSKDTRVFKVEAEGVLEGEIQAGADYKRVCRRIRLVEEISIAGNGNAGDDNAGNLNAGDLNAGDRNAGDHNTGYRNAGNLNTGDHNAGDHNTGYRNAGDCNTGYGNTGYGNEGNHNVGDHNVGNFNAGYGNEGNGNASNLNTGHDNAGNKNAGNRNTGYYNVGNFNAGNRNAGDHNVGDRNAGNENTGDFNAGDRNVGYCNATSCSAGFFCQEEPNVICFDVDTGMKRNEFMMTFPRWSELAYKLLNEGEITFDGFSRLPGITPEKLESLHAKQLAARKKS